MVHVMVDMLEIGALQEIGVRQDVQRGALLLQDVQRGALLLQGVQRGALLLLGVQHEAHLQNPTNPL